MVIPQRALQREPAVRPAVLHEQAVVRRDRPTPEVRQVVAHGIRHALIDAVAKPGTELNKGLRSVRDSDPAFDPKVFLAGAKTAYEMIVTAFASGDRKTLKNLQIIS